MVVLTEEIRKLRTSRMTGNAVWMMMGQGVSVVLQAVYFAILARLLGPANYGVYAGAFAFTNIAAQYSTLGAGTVFMRYVAGRRAEFAVYWGNIVVLTLVIGSLLVVALGVAGHYLLNPASASIVVLAAISNCLLFQFCSEMGRVFQTFEKMRFTAMINMLTNFLRTATAGGMMLMMHRATAFQWAVASTAVSFVAACVAIGCVTYFFGLPKILPLMFPKHSGEGLGYAFAGSTSSAYNDLDKAMLSHYGMNLANGIYSLAYRVIDVATIPILAIREAAMPRLFERGRAGTGAISQLSRALLSRAVPLGAALSLGAFLIAPILPRVAGHNFSESVVALRWLAIIPLFRSIHQMAGSALTGFGMQRYRTMSQLIAAALNFVLNLYLIPRHGWLGAAWASIATDGTLGALNLVLLRRVQLRAAR
jgi:O-antigen/teichoic acid export membrane protein